MSSTPYWSSDDPEKAVKADIARRVYEEHEGVRWGDKGRAEAIPLVETVLEAIREAVAEGKTVELRGFGVFEPQHRRADVARNPRSGEPVEIPARVVPNFRPSTLWKEQVAEAQDPDTDKSKEEDAAA